MARKTGKKLAEFIEKKIEGKTIFTGEVLEFHLDTVILPNGKKTTREWIGHMGAVGIVPIDSSETLYLVEQFRYPTGKMLLEIPAGKLSPNEKPEDCAIRELQEEIGMTCSNLELLSTFFTSPGYSNEIFHLFMANGLSPFDSRKDDDEFLRVVKTPLEKALDSVAKNKISDGKTIIGILLAAQKKGYFRP